MKNFIEHLVQSEKTYEFTIRVAGEIEEGFVDKLENCLQKYELASLSAGKTTPIQESPLHFQRLQNMEVTSYQAVLRYPTVAQHLQKYIADNTFCSEAMIKVNNINEPLEDQSNNMVSDKEPYESLLAQEDLSKGEVSGQELVAGNRVMELLRELEKARSERENEPTAGAPQGTSQDIDTSVTTTSVIGG